MGIDIYANEILEPNQRKYQKLFDQAVALRNNFDRGTAGEETAQKEVTRLYNQMYEVGYLRESYHGGPYVTRYFVAEAFNADTRIPAATLRKRLPIAVMLAIYRHHMVYEQGKGKAIVVANDRDFTEVMGELVGHMTKSRVKDDAALIARITPTQAQHAKELIVSGHAPRCAEQFIRFTEQCEAHELKTGKALMISASW